MIEFCRQQNIPFNEADAVLYKLQKQKDFYKIFTVIFNSLVDNREPASEAVRLYNTVLSRPEIQKTKEELQPEIDELLASGGVFDEDIRKD
jgi:hypothetical protein